MDGLLPRVPYRQWVLALPKRLRFFVHRNPALAGEISRILTSAINRFYADRSGRGGDPSSPYAPAQVLVVQRFGGKANLHVHFHAVVSDGIFALRKSAGVTGELQFIPAPAADLCVPWQSSPETASGKGCCATKACRRTFPRRRPRALLRGRLKMVRPEHPRFVGSGRSS
ncbi:MAG: transposase [Elusimicrobia bacterium]|nr:transposase [Elusimicrobiota bacterium]